MKHISNKTPLVGLATALLACGGLDLHGQVPCIITYQGRMQANGTNFTGTGQFKFAFVDTGTNTARQAAASATVTAGVIASILVKDGGSGYTSAPAVTITDATGTGATAVAVVSGGAVVAVNPVSNGSGYSARPTVTIAPPPPSLAYQTYWSNDGTSSNGDEPASAVNAVVSQGLFTVFLGDTNLHNMTPIPETVFLQTAVALRIWLSDGVGGFEQLSPNQRIGSVAYAMVAAGLTGTQTQTFIGPVTFNPSTGAPFAVRNSTKVEGLNVDLLDGLDSTAFWQLRGNAGTTPGTHFLGTTDNQALEFKVNGLRALRLEDNGDSSDSGTAPDGAPNLIGGSPGNVVGAGVVGATIGGGGAIDWSGFVETNAVWSDYGVVGGGLGNTIAASSPFATIAGGMDNYVTNNAYGGVIGGGILNRVGKTGTVAGGALNMATGTGSFVGGGGSADESSSVTGNSAEGNYSAIAGGVLNSAVGSFAMVPGGYANSASGDYSFAAGCHAKANHAGAFVWGDSYSANIASTNANSVTLRASGGYRLFSNSGATVGAYLSPGGGSWTSMSDRNEKENLRVVDPRSVLARVAAMPVTTWNYKSQDAAVRHIGPMAQDFKAAFCVGESDTGITTIDADGVALAAIQGLNEKLEEKNAVLEKQVSGLTALVNTLVQKVNGGAQ